MTADPKMRPGPLNGIRVLDLTQFLAGPFATQILGDLGAEVIKLESPTGDWARSLPPHFVGEDSCYYLSINRSKKAIAVDMKQPEGLDLVKNLAGKSDILFENFRPGVLDRLGLSWDALSAEYPKLIWASISGFGQSGPYRDRPAYDMIVQAMSGGMSMTGERDGVSVRAGIPLGDLSAGMYATIGALAALEERRTTGKGKFIDISMLDCQVAMTCYQAAYYLQSGQNPGRQGRSHASIPTYRSFPAANNTELVITANTERMWQGLCSALGLEALTKDARFLKNKDRFANREELWPLLEEAFSAKEAKEWVPLLLEQGVPVGEVNQLSDTFNDQQVLHREMLLPIEGSGGRKVKVAGNPLKFLDQPEGQYVFPPALGEDTHDVVCNLLEISESDFRALKDKGVVTEFVGGDTEK
jgi:CoA:oxalate CoA-transferase